MGLGEPVLLDVSLGDADSRALHDAAHVGTLQFSVADQPLDELPNVAGALVAEVLGELEVTDARLRVAEPAVDERPTVDVAEREG